MQDYIFLLSFFSIYSIFAAIVLGRREKVNELALYINSQLNTPKKKDKNTFLGYIKTRAEDKIKNFISDEEKVKILLTRARVNFTPIEFYLLRVISAGVVSILGLIVLVFLSNLTWISILLFSVILAVVGFLLPKFFVLNRAFYRQRQAGKEVLNYTRILAIITSAGGDLLNALKKISNYGNGILAEEFKITLQEIASGKRKSQALLEMAKRLEVKDLTLMLEALVEADKKGVPLAKILREQADRINDSLRNKAIGDAGKASVKLLAPLLLCIFPALLIFILAPAGIQLITQF